jgi:hypothetical protein
MKYDLFVLKIIQWKMDMVVHICNPSTGEAKAEGL